MSTCPRALVIGASETAALLHLPVLAELQSQGRLTLIEICDLRLAQAVEAQRSFGFLRAGSDATAALARPDIDLVYIFGSALLHHELGLAALGAGKHLFVEKPIAPGYVDARALAEAAATRGLIAAGGHNRRFYTALAHVCASAGRAGWSYAEAVFHKPEFGKPPPFGACSWLSGNGIHALDALVFMMGGLPEHLSAHAGGSGAASSTFSVIMRWPGGAQGVFLCDNGAGARREEYAFHAPGETWRLQETGLTLERGGPAVDCGLSPTGDGFAAEHDAFLSAIETGIAPLHALAALAPSLFLAELIEAGHNGPVRLPKVACRLPADPRSGTILLDGVERLRPALASLPAGYASIALEEVAGSDQCRPDIQAAILAAGTPLSDALLDRLPNLSVVGVAGLSLGRHAPERLLGRGITLVNASAAYADSVAEFAIGLAILGRRRAFASHWVMQRGGWGSTLPALGIAGMALRVARRLLPLAARFGMEGRLRRAWRSSRPLNTLAAREQYAPNRALAGTLVGLIGWGANGRAFAHRLIAAGARVLVHSDHATPEDIRAAGAEPAGLHAVLAAEIVSLHRGLTPETRHSLGAPELDRLRPGCVLINVARGALIDPAALLGRLKRGDVTACLDTFEEEPLPARHPLRRLRNVFLTAHIAGGSPDMHAAAVREVIAKVSAHLEGRAVEHVTVARLATMT
jgi:phosphoglycerate dehydrogenase-like enzyme/predicted dehydrogenase